MPRRNEAWCIRFVSWHLFESFATSYQRRGSSTSVSTSRALSVFASRLFSARRWPRHPNDRSNLPLHVFSRSTFPFPRQKKHLVTLRSSREATFQVEHGTRLRSLRSYYCSLIYTVGTLSRTSFLFVARIDSQKNDIQTFRMFYSASVFSRHE